MSSEALNIDVAASPVVETQPIGTPEAKVEVAKPVDERFASKFAALTRKEKEIQAARRMHEEQMGSVKQQQEEIARMRAEIEAEKSSWKSKFKENPLKALEAEGFSFQDLNDIALNDSNPTTEMQLKRFKEDLDSKYSRELAELKKQLQDKEEGEAKNNLERQQVAYKHSLSDTIDKNAEKYDYSSIYKDDAVQLAYEVTEEYYNEHKKVLSPSEALDLVEQYLEDEATKILSAKKSAAKLASKDKAPVSQGGKKESVTISNNMAAEVPRSGSKFLSRDESLKEAAKLIRFTT
jgi:hypothetical protein